MADKSQNYPPPAIGSRLTRTFASNHDPLIVRARRQINKKHQYIFTMSIPPLLQLFFQCHRARQNPFHRAFANQHLGGLSRPSPPTSSNQTCPRHATADHRLHLDHHRENYTAHETSAWSDVHGSFLSYANCGNRYACFQLTKQALALGIQFHYHHHRLRRHHYRWTRRRWIRQSDPRYLAPSCRRWRVSYCHHLFLQRGTTTLQRNIRENSTTTWE